MGFKTHALGIDDTEAGECDLSEEELIYEKLYFKRINRGICNRNL